MSFVLTDEQQKVIEHFGRPLRVLAGPGTGKTTSITRRIKHLIQVRKIPYNEICAITLTRAATAQMRRKLQRECGIKPDCLPRVSTLHALATHLVKHNHQLAGVSETCHPPSESEQKLILLDVTEDMLARGVKLPYKGFPKVSHYVDAYDQQRACGRLPQWVTQDPGKKRNYELFVERYREVLRFYGAIDWTDVVVKALQLVKEHENVRAELHSRTRQLLVDEYQDLNPLEQELVSNLSESADGLCVVGDDDQMIYESFRFADPDGIINFGARYQGAETLPLTVSNRCPPKLIEKALRVIGFNKRRVPKELRPRDPAKIGDLMIMRCPSKKREIEWIVSKIKELNGRGHQYRGMLILFSDGRVAQDYIGALKAANIPCNVQLKVETIFDTQAFALLLATLRAVVNDHDNLAVRECLEHWTDIGSKTIRQLRQLAETGDGSIWHAVASVGENPGSFTQIKRRGSVGEFYKFMQQLREAAGSYRALCELFRARYLGSSNDAGCKTLFAHLDKLAGQEAFVNLADALQQFEEAMEAGEFEADPDEPNEVRIMTMHSAKGCEAPFVFIPALEQDIMPGTRRTNIEEQRRLFYVSITRAQVYVYLSWAYQRTGPEIHRSGGSGVIGRQRSQFLDEVESK